MMNANNIVLKEIQPITEVVKDKIPYLRVIQNSDEHILDIEHDDILIVFVFLKLQYKSQMTLLSSITGVDLLNSDYRFSVVYDLLSLVHNRRLRVKTYVNEINTVFTLSHLYGTADWWEKEVWDMYGIYFLGHIRLKRILTDYGFELNPLRRDFPLSGYEEVQYDLTTKRVELVPLSLSQDIKLFLRETN